MRPPGGLRAEVWWGYAVRPRWLCRRPAFPLVALPWLGVAALMLVGGCTLPFRQSDVAARIAAARTPADHVALARSFSEQASEYSEDASRHRRLAARYEAEGAFASYRHHERTALRMAEHCRMIAERLDGAATELTALAREHEQLASELRGEGR